MILYNLVFSNRRAVRFRRHLLFWLAWCIYWLTTYLIPTQWVPAWNLHGPMPQIEQYGFVISCLRILMNTTLMTMIYIGLTYGILYFILPRYLSKNKNWITTTVFLLLFISIIALINYFFFVMVFSISTRLGYFSKVPDMNFIIPVWGRQVLFNYPTVVGFALAIKLLKNWFLKQKEAAQVATEKINAELQLLKSQVHPHFLFNTLNNIYSFIINDSSAATEELKMIRDYIDLEKIRYGENFNMSLQIQGSAVDKMICPLLLIPFLENSFKHGASQMLTHPWINLDIIIDEEHLHFNLSNSKPALLNEKTITKGLGLRNVKKRLAILYPGTHSLMIADDVMSFSISLKIPLFKPDENLQQFITEKQVYELA